MTLWHIQLHQNLNKRLSSKQFRQIVEEKQVIGLGHPWKNKRGEFVPDSMRFQEEMAIGDIVMARDGKRPIALVEISSDVYEETQIDEDLDWFPIRRKVKLIEFYEERPELEDVLSKILKEGNKKQIQATGTLTKGSDLSKVTNQLIESWWKIAQEKK